MTQSQPFLRDAGAGELDVSVERRRARVLGRILESSHLFQEHLEVSSILGALIRLTHDLFADSSVLLAVRPSSSSGEGLKVVHTDIQGAESAFAERLAGEVAESGVPCFSAEFKVASDRLAGCVPISCVNMVHGALYATVPGTELSGSDEFTNYLRLLCAQAGSALRTAAKVKKLGERLTIMTAESGVDLVRDEVPLSAAKRSFERWLIGARLSSSNGNIAAAARALKMDRGQLSRLVKRHGLDPSSYRS